MHFTKLVLPGVLTLCLACSAIAQTTAPATPQATPEAAVESAKPGKKAKKEGKRSPLAILTAQQLRAFKSVDLSDEQTASLKEVITKHLPAITAAKAKVTSIITPEQRKQFVTAMKDARKSGLKAAEASEKALKSLDLGEEVSKSYMVAQAEVKTLVGNVRTELLAKLTDEQREQIKGAGKGKGKGKANKKKGGKKKKAAADAEPIEDADVMD